MHLPRSALSRALIVVGVTSAVAACAVDTSAPPRSSAAQAFSATCGHTPCTTGGYLAASCDSCVAAICAVDGYCCQWGWDGICVSEVASVCGASCGPTSPPTGCPWPTGTFTCATDNAGAALDYVLTYPAGATLPTTSVDHAFSGVNSACCTGASVEQRVAQYGWPVPLCPRQPSDRSCAVYVGGGTISSRDAASCACP